MFARPSRTRFASVLLTALCLGPAFGVDSVAAAVTSSVVGVWSEPQAGYGFLDAAVAGARSSVELSIYELRDPTLEAALVARAHAGVDVRVILNYDYDGHEENAAALALLRGGGVHVVWAPSGQIFHAKYLVIDRARLFVGSGNLVASDYPSTRDVWVEDVSGRDVAAAAATFAHVTPSMSCSRKIVACSSSSTPKAAFATATANADRLSITFRFQTGTNDLDSRAEADLGRLVALMQLPNYSQMAVSLIGYSGVAGEYEDDRVLSQDRAEAVRIRLKAAGLQNVTAVGVGPAGAIACNLDPKTTVQNQRVEVWLRKRPM